MKVRLLPMNREELEMKNASIKEVQDEFIISNIKNKKASYGFKKGMVAEENDWIFFQLDGTLIGSASLKETKRYEYPDAEGYRGEYLFYPDSINVFKPITKEELKEMSNEFKIFNMAPQNIKINNFPKLIERTKIKNDVKDEDMDNIEISEFVLTLHNEETIYHKVERKGVNTAEITNKNIDFEDEVQKNTKLGNIGEDLVVNYEKKHLSNIGRVDLADSVKATRNFAGNAEKYDVLSFEDDGTKKYIEVKTTTGGLNNAFHISENEVKFSESVSENYYLYRLYNFNKKSRTADFKIIKGSLKREKLTPTNYVCSIGE